MRILVADDHLLFADMMEGFLAALWPDAAVAKARTLGEAETLVAAGPFDFILLDLNMPGMNGLAGLSRLRAMAPGSRIAMVSGQMRRTDIRGALRAGADGFLPKNMRGEVFASALRLIAAGGRYVPEGALDEDEAAVAPAEDLTPREQEVLEQLSGGRSNREIAANLTVSEVTVKMHLLSIFRKLGAKNRGDAIRIALTRRT